MIADAYHALLESGSDSLAGFGSTIVRNSRMLSATVASSA
jgi:hypothetical protein